MDILLVFTDKETTARQNCYFHPLIMKSRDNPAEDQYLNASNCD